MYGRTTKGVAYNRLTDVIRQLADLKRIEQLADRELKESTGGRWYEGQQEHVEKLQKIFRDARIKRLELELNRI